MKVITALHKLQGDQVVTALGNLPGPDDYMSHDDLVALARQIQQASIDNQRLAYAPLRHPATPNYLEYPSFDESADMDPCMLRGRHD